MIARPRRFWPLYLVWIAVCAILFLLLRGAEDPSRRSGRIRPSDAGERALAALRDRDPARFSSYEVIHVAFARAGEGAAERRWVILCNRGPRSAMDDAIVVELRAEDGALLRIRKPG
ncbi:MAG: hypothetical protein JJE51_14810 [Thermoanaerobaculia bacterium]|nr:hypothetical protein [Thermoanaerobaculia bacterium]